MKKLKIVQFILFTILGGSAYAQVEGVSADNPRYFIDEAVIINENAVGSFVLTGGNSLAIDKSPISLLKEETESGKLYLKLDLGEDFVVKSPEDDDFDIKLDVKYRLIGNNTLWQTKSFELTPQTPEQLFVLDLTSQLDGNTGIEVAVNSSGPNNGISVAHNGVNATFLDQLIAEKLRFKATFVREYKVDVRLANNDNLADPVVLAPILSTGVLKKRQLFTWTSSDDFPNYEIQILRIFNEDPNNTNVALAKSVKLDWNKALKIETQSYKKQIELILAEGTGLYTWRVRPIGTYYVGGIGNSDNYGKWSVHQPQYDEDVPATVLNLNGGSMNVFFYEELDDQKNWNYTRVFTEGDETGEQGVRTSEGVTYADGLLRTRQAQQYNSSNNTTIVSQTISDYSGRPALTTLPVPIENTDLNGYKETFVQNSTGTVYTAKDYDDEMNVNSPSEIHDLNTDFNYYNGDRTDGVADAEGFAYSRTIFKTDGTGRATESSGVGKKHAIGDRSSGKGRTTTVLYSSPSDAELIRIFGDEAPLAESVIKTITKDPNDVVSLAYTSKEGKTIATALISDETENLLKLNDNNNAFTVDNVTTQNVLNFNKFVSAKRVAIILDNTEVTLGYKVEETATPACGEGCNYRVRFYLTDLTNGIRYQSNIHTLPSGGNEISFTTENLVFTNIADQSILVTSTDGKFNLDAGEYLITKEVFSETNANLIVQEALERADLIEDILVDITDRMDAVNNSTDLENFIDFLTNTAPTHYSYPTGFSVNYNQGTGQLEIINNGNANSGDFSGCSDCGTSSITIPTPEICEVCEGTDLEDANGNSLTAIQTIRDAVSSEITYNSADWNSIKAVVDNYFMAYLIEKLQAEYGLGVDVQAKLTKIAPGFTQESLAYMLTNMLASKYYTGMSKNGYRAIENEAGGLDYVDVNGVVTTIESNRVAVGVTTNLDYNYDCEDLYHCWIQSIDMINSFEFDGEVNIMDDYNDGNAGGESSEDHADSDNAQDGSASGNALLNFVISWKMRRFNDSDEGQLSVAELDAIVSLPNLFMNCIGYEFAEIIDDAYVSDNSLLPSDYNTATPYGITSPDNVLTINSVYSELGTQAPMMIADFDVTPNTPEEVVDCHDDEFERLNYAYITKPEWMFKYFVYNSNDTYNGSLSTSINDGDDHILTQTALEIANNYNEIGTCSTPLCFEVNNYYHDSWNKDQRLSFYYQISGAKKTVEECEDPQEPTPPNVNLNLTEENLLNLTKEALDDAVESCQSRRGEIQGRLITALEDACYEIVEECDASGTQINELGLEAMTDAVVQECIAKVHTVTVKIFHDENMEIDLANPSLTYYSGAEYGSEIYGPDHTAAPNVSPEFPYHDVIECCAYDETGTPITPSLSKRKINLFATCDQVILDQVNSWSFIPYITPATGCTTATPEWEPACPNGDCGTQECTPSGATEPNVYSEKTTISASTNP